MIKWSLKIWINVETTMATQMVKHPPPLTLWQLHFLDLLAQILIKITHQMDHLNTSIIQIRWIKETTSRLMLVSGYVYE